MSRYSVVRNATYGCIVIEGAIPVADLAALTQAWQQRDPGGPAWIMDTLLSGALPGVNMVFGPPDACLAWRDKLGIAPVGPPRPPLQFAGQAALDAEAPTAPAPRFAGRPPYPSVTCPHCLKRSYNPIDIAQRYCANCNVYLGDDL